MNKFEKCLEEWNGGFRGAKIRLSRELKVDDSTVSAWLKGRSKPGKDKISKMSKIFKKSEAEIKGMFVEDNSANQTAGRDNNGTMTHNACAAELEELRQELRETRESLGDKIKVLEAKLDLILEKIKK